jgi:hypothetical protein
MPFKVIKGIKQAGKILDKEKTSVIFSKGGFVAIPTVIAGARRNIPIISHESDYTIGLANKISSLFSKKVLTSFPETAKTIKNGEYIGSPIRKSLFSVSKKDALESFGGALLIVSHDRYFLNRLCDTIIAFEGNGELYIQTGDYDYYLEKFEEREAKKLAVAAPKVKNVSAPVVSAGPKTEKLSFKENRELEEMEGKIEALDEKICEIEALFSAPDFFEKYGKDSPKLQAELEDLKNQQTALYERWEFLEQKKERCRK